MGKFSQIWCNTVYKKYEQYRWCEAVVLNGVTSNNWFTIEKNGKCNDSIPKLHDLWTFLGYMEPTILNGHWINYSRYRRNSGNDLLISNHLVWMIPVKCESIISKYLISIDVIIIIWQTDWLPELTTSHYIIVLQSRIDSHWEWETIWYWSQLLQHI